MAKLAKVTEEVKEEVKVEKEKVEKEKVKKEKIEEVKVEEVPEVEVEIPAEVKVEVDVEATKIDKKDIPEKSVKIRALVDHKCVIGGEVYDLKKGKCYNVPISVRYRLNKAGLLAPL